MMMTMMMKMMMNVTHRQVRYWNLHYDIRDITTQKDLNRHLDVSLFLRTWTEAYMNVGYALKYHVLELSKNVVLKLHWRKNIFAVTW